jgi:hypothetical protein
VHPPSSHSGEEAADELAKAITDDDLRDRVLASFTDRGRLAEAEAANVAALLARTGDVPMIRVPEQTDEVHDLAALLSLGSWLFGRRI